MMLYRALKIKVITITMANKPQAFVLVSSFPIKSMIRKNVKKQKMIKKCVKVAKGFLSKKPSKPNKAIGSR